MIDTRKVAIFETSPLYDIWRHLPLDFFSFLTSNRKVRSKHFMLKFFGEVLILITCLLDVCLFFCFFYIWHKTKSINGVVVGFSMFYLKEEELI